MCFVVMHNYDTCIRMQIFFGAARARNGWRKLCVNLKEQRGLKEFERIIVEWRKFFKD